jgi:hypothetical protein
MLLMVTLALFALLLGGGLVAQGYLYQQPADRMPVRALVGAVVVGVFITFWVWVDQRNPGRYDTFFNFAAYTTTEFNEFEALRWTSGGDGKIKTDASGNPAEVAVKFKRSSAKGAQFLEEGTGNPFKMNGTTTGGTAYMTGAIRVKTEADPEPVRYNAVLQESSNPQVKSYPPGDRKFVEEKGSRYVMEQQLGTLFVPSTGTVVVALLLNFLLVAAWLVAFWPVMRFSLTHALILTIACALLSMLTVMPLLFKLNRPLKPAPPAASQESGVRSQGSEFSQKTGVSK